MEGAPIAMTNGYPDEDSIDDMLVDLTGFAQTGGKAGKMAIYRADATGMLQHHHITVSTLLAGKGYGASGGCLDASADGCGVIHALVRAPSLQHRMETCQRKS